MGYSLNKAMVEGNLFDTSNKWLSSVAINMGGYFDRISVKDAVVEAYYNTPAEVRGTPDSFTGCLLVVINPYHKHSHPVMQFLH